MTEFRVDRKVLPSLAGDCEAEKLHLISRGHQAEIYMFPNGSTPLVLKVAHGKGLAAWLRRRMLRKEERIYRRLRNVYGLARCHGLFEGKYLLLDYIDSVPYRQARLQDRERFLVRLRRQIDAIHAEGVAHGDLKTRANIVVASGERPCIVDFGIAVTRKPGFAPVNHWLFNMFVQFDRNAWIKLKYRKCMDRISPEDMPYHRVTWIERLARMARLSVRRLSRMLPRR